MTNSTPENEKDFFDSSTKEFLDKYGLQKISYGFFDKFRFIVGAGLGLIAALAWDETLKSFFDEIFPKMTSSFGSLMYAIFLTVIATAVTLILRHISRRIHKK